MSVHTTFIVADGDDLDIIKDWIQNQLYTGSTFKAVKVFVLEEKSAYEFESEEVERFSVDEICEVEEDDEWY